MEQLNMKQMKLVCGGEEPATETRQTGKPITIKAKNTGYDETDSDVINTLQ